MEKGKRIQADIQLPEPIIQHIQSFLDGKEAAQTTLFSKSWYTAWLTRPNLDFDQNHFVNKSVQFWKFVKKTMERYEKLKIKIDSLKVWIRGSCDAERNPFNRLIMKAVEMGATDLDLTVHDLNTEFVLSPDVFGSENLIRLSVTGCEIGLVTNGKISCSRLKSLIFKRVYVEGSVIWDIISSCPLIENLVVLTADWRGITEFRNHNVVDGFHKLRSLRLYRVNVHSYFDDFSSKFPCIKDLTLHGCRGFKVMQISSSSLEYIKFFEYHNKLVLMFDVPRIRKFTFSGSHVPLLSFKTRTSKWESYISIKRRCPPSATWFLELSRLLKKLSQSKVSLTLAVLSEKSSEYAGKIRGLRNKPKVENLTINGPSSVCPDIFYSLFWCCRPIYITQHWYPTPYMRREKRYDDEFMKFVYKRITQHVGLNSCIAYQKMTAGKCDLEEVSEEFYDEAISAWRPRLLDTSTSLGAADEHKIRLHLRWLR